MDERDVGSWERYLSGKMPEDERRQLEDRLESDRDYKDQLLAFMLLNGALATLAHTPAIEAEISKVLETHANQPERNERRVQFATPFGALFHKRTKKELWAVLGAAMLLLMAGVYWFMKPGAPQYAHIEYRADDGNAFNEEGDPNAIMGDSIVVAFHARNKEFWNTGAAYEWAGDTLNVYRLRPDSDTYLLPSMEKGVYVLRTGDKMYAVRKGQRNATKLSPLP